MNWHCDDDSGTYTWNGYTVSQWTGEAWGPRGFYMDLQDLDEAKLACEKQGRGVVTSVEVQKISEPISEKRDIEA